VLRRWVVKYGPEFERSKGACDEVEPQGGFAPARIPVPSNKAFRGV
jgi:hypothetical protein